MSIKNLVELTLFSGTDLICTLIGNELFGLFVNKMTEDFPTFSDNLLDISHASTFDSSRFATAHMMSKFSFFKNTVVSSAK